MASIANETKGEREEARRNWEKARRLKRQKKEEELLTGWVFSTEEDVKKIREILDKLTDEDKDAVEKKSYGDKRIEIEAAYEQRLNKYFTKTTNPEDKVFHNILIEEYIKRIQVLQMRLRQNHTDKQIKMHKYSWQRTLKRYDDAIEKWYKPTSTFSKSVNNTRYAEYIRFNNNVEALKAVGNKIIPFFIKNLNNCNFEKENSCVSPECYWVNPKSIATGERNEHKIGGCLSVRGRNDRKKLVILPVKRLAKESPLTPGQRDLAQGIFDTDAARASIANSKSKGKELRLVEERRLKAKQQQQKADMGAINEHRKWIEEMMKKRSTGEPPSTAATDDELIELQKEEVTKSNLGGGYKRRKPKRKTKRKRRKMKRITRKKRGGKSRRRKHRKKYRKQKTKRRRTYRKTRKKTKRRR